MASSGPSTQANLYSYGTGAQTDRALGSIGNTADPAAGHFAYGVQFENSSGQAVTLFPYGLVARYGTPHLLNIYVVHEGLLGVLSGVRDWTTVEAIGGPRRQDKTDSASRGARPASDREAADRMARVAALCFGHRAMATGGKRFPIEVRVAEGSAPVIAIASEDGTSGCCEAAMACAKRYAATAFADWPDAESVWATVAVQ